MTSTPAPRRILGIDPGLQITGYGLVQETGQGLELVEAGVVRIRRDQTLEQRLLELHRGVTEIIESLHPTEMAIEELYTHYERPSTAILMGHARGVICLAAAQSNLPINHYRATQIKSQLTGNGRAPKSQVQLAVAAQLHVTQSIEPPDVADALAIAMCHYFISCNPLRTL